MHTTISPFTLAPWKEPQPYGHPLHGWRGTSPEFGEIQVLLPAGRDAPNSLTTQVRGGRIPPAVFETRGPHTEIVRRPTLNRSTLHVGDAPVRMDRNRWAPTRRGRSLRLTYLGDTYRLTALDRRTYELVRTPDPEDPGVRVTVRRSGLGGRRGITVRTTGRTLPADISLAVLFTGIDRSVLTGRGAIRAGLSRVLNLWAEAQA